MPRTRYLKPDFFFDEELCAHPFQHRLCYQGLWVNADREGRLEDRPQRLKAKIFPYDAVDVDAILAELARTGFIIRYVANGRAYIAVKPSGWKKHQFPRKDEPTSEIPAPDEHSVAYGSMGQRDELGASLRKTATGELPNGDAQVSEELGIGNGEWGIRNEGTSAEALTRSAAVDASPVILTFPTIGKQGHEWHLTTQQVDDWQKLYPGLGILVEAQKALAWLRANENRRKTSRGMPAFLVNWFNRAANTRGSSGTGPRPVRMAEQEPQRASVDWWEECGEFHNHECGGDRYQHMTRMAVSRQA